MASQAYKMTAASMSHCCFNSMRFDRIQLQEHFNSGCLSIVLAGPRGCCWLLGLCPLPPSTQESMQTSKQWIPADFNGWILMYPDGFQWNLMDPIGFGQVPKESNGFGWILTESQTHLRILMDSMETDGYYAARKRVEAGGGG